VLTSIYFVCLLCFKLSNSEASDSSVGGHVECRRFNVVSPGSDQSSATDHCPASVDHQLLMLQKELSDARAQIKKIVRVFADSLM